MVAKWMEFVHPRAKEFFGMGPQGMLAEVLTKIARNTAAGTNPILSVACFVSTSLLLTVHIA